MREDDFQEVQTYIQNYRQGAMITFDIARNPTDEILQKGARVSD